MYTPLFIVLSQFTCGSFVNLHHINQNIYSDSPAYFILLNFLTPGYWEPLVIRNRIIRPKIHHWTEIVNIPTDIDFYVNWYEWLTKRKTRIIKHLKIHVNRHVDIWPKHLWNIYNEVFLEKQSMAFGLLLFFAKSSVIWMCDRVINTPLTTNQIFPREV